MVQRMQPVGFLVALVLVVGCNGAPSQNGVAARNALASPHIIMGRDANIEDFPYQASIELFTLHICGAVVISENYAITAAHCLDSSLSLWTWMKKIRAGSTTSIPIFGNGGTTHEIVEALYHPKWNIATVDYDIGIMLVSQPFVFGARVQPIPVPPAGEANFLDYSRNVTVSGWGLTSPEGWWASWRLKTIDIPLVERSRCAQLHLEDPEAPKITSRMLCAAGRGQGDTCQGDSGGALVHKGQVIGVVSWGMPPCNNDRFPSVFTNVLDPEIREFITERSGI